MSMNLIGSIEGHCVEFPFQTPTNLTYKVLAIENRQTRFEIIADWINQESGWHEDIKQEKIEETRRFLFSDKLNLGMI